jgi:hypothetical protein
MSLTLVEQKAVSLDFMYLSDRAIIESSSEKRRSVIRRVKQEVKLLAVLQLTSCLFSDHCLFGAIQGRDFS